jgi:hypothetical protein
MQMFHFRVISNVECTFFNSKLQIVYIALIDGWSLHIRAKDLSEIACQVEFNIRSSGTKCVVESASVLD